VKKIALLTTFLVVMGLSADLSAQDNTQQYKYEVRVSIGPPLPNYWNTNPNEYIRCNTGNSIQKPFLRLDMDEMRMLIYSRFGNCRVLENFRYWREKDTDILIFYMEKDNKFVYAEWYLANDKSSSKQHGTIRGYQYLASRRPLLERRAAFKIKDPEKEKTG
jgi:hypothetical protein